MQPIANASIVAPPLPPPPASYGRITGRLVSQCPPTTLTLTGLFAFSLAGWQYFLDNMVIAGSLTGIGVVTLASAGCFWRYIGAKAIEDSAGDMRSTVDSLQVRLDWFKSENEKLAAEVAKFDEIIAKWIKDEDVHREQYEKSNQELAITADEFKARVEELERFVNLHLKFEEGIHNLKAQLRKFSEIAPDVRSKLDIIKDASEAIQQLPSQLEVKITNLSTLDDELINALNEFRNYVSKFIKCTKGIVKVYAQTKQERDDFKQQVDEFESSNNALELLVARWEEAQKKLGDRLESYQELASALQEAVANNKKPTVAAPTISRKKKGSRS